MKTKKNPFLIALSALAWTVIAALCALVIYMLYSNISGKPPRVFGYTMLNVVTGSMEPTIKTGSFIIIKDTDTSELEKGDIITFYSTENAIKGELNTHRIDSVEISEDGSVSYITKGDAVYISDTDPVKPDQIVGRYVCTLGFMNLFGNLFSKPVFYFFIVLIPALIFFIVQIVNLVKTAKPGKDSLPEGDVTQGKNPGEEDPGDIDKKDKKLSEDKDDEV